MSGSFAPMTKATGIGSLPDVLERHAGSRGLSRAFRHVDLSMEIVDRLDSRIPLPSLTALFDAAARIAGDRAFGMQVGLEMAPATFGTWVEYSLQANDLRSAIARASQTIGYHQDGGRLDLQDRGSFALFRYHSVRDQGVSLTQHSDHIIGPMSQFVRAFLGPRWQPEWVELNYCGDSQSRVLEQYLECPVLFSRQAVAIAIRRKDIDRCAAHPRSTPRLLTLPDVHADAVTASNQDPERTILAIVQLRLLDGHTDIDGAARLAGVGVQTLQRRLRREGTDYRTLVNRARQIRAQALLQETHRPVTEIAIELGYSDHANFTRSFKRLVGTSPSSYRAMSNGQSSQ